MPRPTRAPEARPNAPRAVPSRSRARDARTDDATAITGDLEVTDPELLLALTGPSGTGLRAIEKEYGIQAGIRGNTLLLRGEARAVAEAEMVQPALQMQEAARRMSAAGYGRIIVFASMSAKTGVHHNVAPYAAAKGGLLAFARVLAAETAEHGVTVNGIATALFEPQVKTMTEEKRTSLKGGIPVGRFGRSEEAAHAVLFLASANAGFVTGECLNLSGGRFMD